MFWLLLRLVMSLIVPVVVGVGGQAALFKIYSLTGLDLTVLGVLMLLAGPFCGLFFLATPFRRYLIPIGLFYVPAMILLIMYATMVYSIRVYGEGP